jgi:hypothetical protein
MNNQAKEFLANCNATMKIEYLFEDKNKLWNDNVYRNVYRASIKTPLGVMSVKFWDSIHNTENDIEPTEYDILACLQKYELGSLEDFASEFGYDLDDVENRWNAKQIYKAVCREYEKVCRCFTSEQIELLQEIQ